VDLERRHKGSEGKGLTFLMSSGCIESNHKHRHFQTLSATERGKPARIIAVRFVSEISGGTIDLIVLRGRGEEGEMIEVEQ
jgi:hypothetical protein